MNKEKVLISSFSLDYGGIEKSLITLLKNFDYQRYDVTLVLEQKIGVFLKEVPSNVKVIEYCVSKNKNVIKRKIINFIKKILFMKKHYKEFDSSICYATYSKPCSFVARVTSNNTIMYVHSNYKYVYANHRKQIQKFFNGVMIKKFNHIVFVSNEAKRDFLTEFPGLEVRLCVINNLVDYENILCLAKEKIDNIVNNKIIFLFVGRLEEKSKRISRIIEVANKFKNNKILEFWIVGDGPDKVDYEELIKKYQLTNIKLLGMKKNPYPYMKKCNYLLLTSDYEGFPVVYNEAIVLNKPILTTIDVSDDYISIDGRFGLIMDKNVENIYNTIKYVLNNNFNIKETIDFAKINDQRVEKIEKLMGED